MRLIRSGATDEEGSAHLPNRTDVNFPSLSYEGDPEFEEARERADAFVSEYFDRHSPQGRRQATHGKSHRVANSVATEPSEDFEVGPSPRRSAGRSQRRGRGQRASMPSRLLFWVAGADEKHMLGQRKEHFFYQILGFSVVLTSAMAVIGMTLFIRLSIPGSWIRDIGFGLFWGLLIFWIDRWLVARLPYGPLKPTNDGNEPPLGLKRFIGYTGRFLLALLLAFTISGPIILALFQPEVDQQLILNQTADKSAAAEKIQNREDFVARRNEITTSVAAAEALAKQKDADAATAQNALDDEISGRGGSGVRGCATECVQKRAALARAVSEASAAEDAASAARARALSDTEKLNSDVSAAISQSQAAINAGSGSLARERALFDVMNADPIVYIRYLTISILLLLVDIMPILLKMTSTGPSTQTLHDRSVRLNAVRVAAQEDLRASMIFEEDRAAIDIRTYDLQSHRELDYGAIELERNFALRARQVRADCESELTVERLRLRHELLLFELRTRHAHELEAIRARFGRPSQDLYAQLRGVSHATEPFAPRLVGGRWVLVRPLVEADAGSAGSVYLARDGRDPNGRDNYVVKTVRHETGVSIATGPSRESRARRQLMNEQLWSLQIRSRFVAPVADTGLDPHYGLFIVTQLYPTTLAKKLASDGFVPTLDWALRITEQILRGLVDSFDNAGLVHLDVKPANIALNEDGEVRLLDFGIARTIGASSSRSDSVGQGTRWYAPPEQLTGRDRNWPSSACDVRATFAVLYEIVTGAPPLYREALMAGLVEPSGRRDPHRAVELWELLLSGVPDEPSNIVPRLPKAVNDLIVRSLDQRPLSRAPGPDSLDARNALTDIVALRAGVRSFANVPVGASALSADQERGAQSTYAPHHAGSVDVSGFHGRTARVSSATIDNDTKSTA